MNQVENVTYSSSILSPWKVPFSRISMAFPERFLEVKNARNARKNTDVTSEMHVASE